MPESTPKLAEPLEADRARQYYTELFQEFKSRSQSRQDPSAGTTAVLDIVKQAFLRRQVGIALYETGQDMVDKPIPSRVIQLDDNVPPRYFITATEAELSQTELCTLPKEELDTRMQRFIKNIHQVAKQISDRTQVV